MGHTINGTSPPWDRVAIRTEVAQGNTTKAERTLRCTGNAVIFGEEGPGAQLRVRATGRGKACQHI